MKTVFTEILDAAAEADPRLSRGRLAASFALLLLSVPLILAGMLTGEGVARQVLALAAVLSLVVSVYLPMEAKRTMRTAAFVGAAATLLVISLSIATVMTRGGGAASLEIAVVVAALVVVVPLVALAVMRKVRVNPAPDEAVVAA